MYTTKYGEFQIFHEKCGLIPVLQLHSPSHLPSFLGGKRKG